MLETATVGLGNVATWHRRGIQRATTWGVEPDTRLTDLPASEPVDWVHRPRHTHTPVFRRGGCHTTVSEAVRDGPGA